MNQKRVLKWMIIFILLVFLLSTWLVSVMYFADKWAMTGTWTWENLSGDMIGTWTILSGSNITGSNLTGKSLK